MTAPVKPQVDWFIVEKEYRAGIRSLRDIAADAGITEGAIRKRAKKDDWSRDLQAKIQAKAEEKVRKETVRTSSTQLSASDEKVVVEVNAEVVAQADLLNRKDVVLSIDVGRGQLEELALLGRSDMAERLEWLGEVMYKPTDDKGTDKQNDLYRYIISLGGRVKSLKDVVASLSTMITLQRKILKLDQEANSNQAAVDEILRKINAGVDD